MSCYLACSHGFCFPCPVTHIIQERRCWYFCSVAFPCKTTAAAAGAGTGWRETGSHGKQGWTACLRKLKFKKKLRRYFTMRRSTRQCEGTCAFVVSAYVYNGVADVSAEIVVPANLYVICTPKPDLQDMPSDATSTDRTGLHAVPHDWDSPICEPTDCHNRNERHIL